MELNEQTVRSRAHSVPNRQDFWVNFLGEQEVGTVAELGVYRGDFAARLLRDCPAITKYYMIDPWRHLDDWNKPANKNDDTFERFYQETLDKTAAQAEKRVVLRGRTLEVCDQIGDGELDFAYVDGDHTLRGITTDLMKVYPKIRDGGWIGGDDFCRSMFQHADAFEPTLVFPYAVYFAESVGARIFALPYNQFLLEKNVGGTHEFIDVTGGKYAATTLKDQLDQRPKGSGEAAPGAPDRPSVTQRVLRKVGRG